MPLHTIGYEAATVDALIAALQSARVTHLVDVRALPLSRRPGFSKTALAGALNQAGIAYTHLKHLGTPPEGRAAARRHDHAALQRIYAAQLETPPALAQAAQLQHLAAEHPIALLCFERDPHACHRTLLAAAAFPGQPVTHLMP